MRKKNTFHKNFQILIKFIPVIEVMLEFKTFGKQKVRHYPGKIKDKFRNHNKIFSTSGKHTNPP